jgi:hypothetical protein
MNSMLCSFVVAIAVVAGLSGCVHPHGMPPGQAKKVVHVHAHGCGHECVGGNWVTVSGGPSKGHRGKH